MNKLIGISLTAILVLALTGCGLLVPNAVTPTIAPTNTIAAFPTEPVVTEIPLPTAVPPTATPSPTATPAQISMISAEVTMDTYSLRSGPGRLFERIETYDSGAVVSLFGREITNNWVLVKTSDNYSGWMNVIGLKPYGDINALPLFKVDDAQVLQGHVYLPGRIPATAIQIAMSPSGSDSSTAPLESVSNQDGLWVIYLPKDTMGQWIVGPNAWVCADTNAATMTAEGCTLNGTLPSAQEITMPFSPELAIEFEILPLNP